jgi:NitT/TauT family transport system substrate-binding protein
MRVMMHHDADPGCPLVCFAQVVARDPFLLVGRGRKPAFRWRDLVGLRVAPAGDVPTPWMTFQDDLQRAGLDPAAIAGRRRLRPMADNVRAFLRGTVDVIQVFEPHADPRQRRSRHVWHRFSERGDVVCTTFYATRRFTRARREACRRLVRGMARATALSPRRRARSPMPWRRSCRALARSPDAIVGAYRASGLWRGRPIFRPRLLRLKAALVSGADPQRPAYEKVVDAALSRAD